eukprot:COSAG04_NODE_3585_length_2690_cov_6.461598_2_plen_83_part_00
MGSLNVQVADGDQDCAMRVARKRRMAAEHRNEAKSKSTQSMLDDALGVVSRTAGLRGDGDNPAVVRHIEVPVGQRRNIGRER